MVTALADCLTSMDADKSPFEVEGDVAGKQNQENYLTVTALKGRRGRAPTGKDIKWTPTPRSSAGCRQEALPRDEGREAQAAARRPDGDDAQADVQERAEL